ncbi:MAG: hypothetical protein AB7D51_13775 [Desulfovibrionaceae bacterium]
MQKIPLKLAKPGMKLARAVARKDGLTVVAEGVELTAALLSRLESMDIDRIVVQGEAVDLGSGGGTAYDERLARLDHLFRAYSGDQWMLKVKAFLRRYFQLKAAAHAAALAAQEADAAALAEGAEAGADGSTDGSANGNDDAGLNQEAADGR